MSKEGDNSFGVAGVILGILGIIFIANLGGIILSIIGIVFSNIQKKRMPNSWSKAGFILNIIGIIGGIILFFVLIYILKNNPQIAQQLQQLATTQQ